MSRKNPLDVIQIKEPCHESWDAMEGDAKVRFCAGCQRHVHNLSAMPKEEAERLLCASAGRLCVRYEVGPDGSPRTLEYQPSPAGARGGWKLWTAMGAGGALIAGAVQVLVYGKPVSATPPPPVLMGAPMPIVQPTPTTAPATRPVLMGEPSSTTRPTPPILMGKPSAPPPPKTRPAAASDAGAPTPSDHD